MIQPSTAGSLVGRENEVCIVELEWGTDDSALTLKTFQRLTWSEIPKSLKLGNNLGITIIYSPQKWFLF